MIINDLDDYYIVFDTKNRNIELDTLINLINKRESELIAKVLNEYLITKHLKKYCMNSSYCCMK